MKFSYSEYKGKTACVLGAGKSGIACANMLARKGFKVLLSDSGIIKNKSAVEGGIVIEENGHTDKVLDCGFIVKSPGLLPDTPIIKSALKKGMPIFSEAETAIAFYPAHTLLAITGTNGKTTTTALLGEIIKAHTPDKAHTLGNIGTPFSDAADKIKEGSFISAEFSSYQIDDSAYLAPKVSAILNITPDHAEHHGNMENYVRAKSKIFRHQRADDFCVFNAGDEYCLKLAEECSARKLFFSADNSVPTERLNAYFADGKIRFDIDGITADIVPPRLPGAHNIENAMAAGLMALSAGIGADIVSKVFATFKGVEHRIEFVREINGVKFFNDSKATNVDSTLTALKAFNLKEKRIFLILGGRDKGAPYAPLTEHIKTSVKEILTIGEAAEKIEKELRGTANITNCGDIKHAVDYALKKAQAGDIVLLSPACASFDQFENFEQRGQFFKQIISAN